MDYVGIILAIGAAIAAICLGVSAIIFATGAYKGKI